MIDRLRAAISTGPLLLDAALGTRLVGLGLQLNDDDPALWNLTRPEAIAELHRRDVAAGSQALLTNTFGANRVWLRRFGAVPQFKTINRLAVQLARREAGAERLVIGSIGPSASAERGAYLEQASVLVEAGVDALLFETHRGDQAEIALNDVGPHLTVPLLVSLYQWPDHMAKVARRLADLGAAAIGLNCVSGMEPSLRVAEALRACTELPLIVKPSAGLPGDAPWSPESFARESATMFDLAPILVGGCCGTDDSHLAALRTAWYHQRHPGRRETEGR